MRPTAPNLPRQTHTTITALICGLLLATGCATSALPTPHHDAARDQTFELFWLGHRLLQLAIERESPTLARAGAELLAPFERESRLEVDSHAPLPFEAEGPALFLVDPHAPLRALDPTSTSAPTASTPHTAAPRSHLGRLARGGRAYAVLAVPPMGPPLSVALIGERYSRFSLWLYDARGRLVCADRSRLAYARCEVATSTDPSGRSSPEGPLDLVVLHDNDRPMSFLLFTP